MGDNANTCGPPPIPEGCTGPFPSVLSLTFDEHQCGYMGGQTMLVFWSGGYYRGVDKFFKPSTSVTYTYDIVLRYGAGGWEMENFGCFHHLEPGGPGCTVVGQLFDMAGHTECGCSLQGGFEVLVEELP